MSSVFDCTARAASAWFLGLFLFFGIYIVVQAAFGLNLEPVSATVWPVPGDVTPVLFIVFGYEQLRWLHGRRSQRFEAWINCYGAPVVLLVTPRIGVWAVAATAKALGTNRVALVVSSFVSITVCAIAIGAGIAFRRG